MIYNASLKCLSFSCLIFFYYSSSFSSIYFCYLSLLKSSYSSLFSWSITMNFDYYFNELFSLLLEFLSVKDILLFTLLFLKELLIFIWLKTLVFLKDRAGGLSHFFVSSFYRLKSFGMRVSLSIFEIESTCSSLKLFDSFWGYLIVIVSNPI